MDDSNYADCGLIPSWWLPGAYLVAVMVQGPRLVKEDHSSITVNTFDYPIQQLKKHIMHRLLLRP
jgi:hypothetical protein